MKTLILSSLLLVSPLLMSPMADGETSRTTLTMAPWWAIDCAVTNAPEVNRHGPLEKIQDDESVAIWGFKTVVGSCQDGQFNVGPLSATAQAYADRDKLFTLQSHVKAHVQLVSENEAYVTLIFDKKEIFKNKSADRFLMTFYPGRNSATRLEDQCLGTILLVSAKLRRLPVEAALGPSLPARFGT